MIDKIDENLLLSLPKFREQEEFWLGKLSGFAGPTLLMPALNSITQTHREDQPVTLDISFPAQLSSRMYQLSKGSGLSVYLLLLTAVSALIYRYNNARGGELDIIVMSPVYIPDRSEETLNHFVYLRNMANGVNTFKQLLLNIRQTVLEAYDNQDFPMERILRKLNQNAGSEFISDEMTNVLCGLKNIHQWDEEVQNQLAAELLFLFKIENETISGQLCFSTAYHDKDYMSQVPEHLVALVSQAMRNLDLNISMIPLLSEDSKKKLLVELNNTTTDYPKDKTIPQLFQEQAEKHPDRVALIFKSHHITYRELDRESGIIATDLQGRGVQPNSIVAVKEERSLEMLFAIMGILKAGGAYLPIETDYPQERIDYMLADSSARMILNRSKVSPINSPNAHNERGRPQDGEVSSTNLAYIIYTSGTTGKPKGVLTSHRNVIRVVKETNFIHFSPVDRVLQLSNYAFDGSVFDIYGALLNGAALVLIDKESASDAAQLAAVIIGEAITSFFMTSTLFNTLVDLEPDFMCSLKTLMVGGERLSAKHCKKALKYNGTGWLVNGYGPTETTVFATYFPIDEINENQKAIPIGRPLANTTAYILDQHMQPLPAGVTGELYIGGDGLAHGYLNEPELTHDRFPTALWGERLYRTGDLAALRLDGNIEFFGRIDRQVKIRGFRIELEEIEKRIMEYSDVNGVVVIDRAGTIGERYLCAYVTTHDSHNLEKPLDTAALRSWLLETLPVFMVPAHIICLDSFPLTANNKLDYNALPEPELLDGIAKNAGPNTEIEMKLADLWAEVLFDGQTANNTSKNIDTNYKNINFNIDADFFSLGGHSLKATLLVSRVRKQMGIQIPLKTIFLHPTIRTLAKYLETLQPAISRTPIIEPAELREYYPLSAAQKRLYFIYRLHPESTAYNIPLVVEIVGEPPIRKLETAFTALIQRHESLRTAFHLIEDQPVQIIHDNFKFKIDPIHTNDPAQLKSQPFDLSVTPQLRVSIHEIGGNRFALVIQTHHIVMDGMSLNILVSDFKALFLERDLPSLNIHYKDFATWQNHYTEQQRIKSQGKYWLAMFEGDIPVLDLPYDFHRAKVSNFEGLQERFHWDERMTLSLNRLAGQLDCTLYAILLAMVDVFLARICGQEDIIVGMPIAGRMTEELNGLIGMFVNTLAIRSQPESDKTFENFAREIKSLLLDSFENQDYPFEELVDHLSSQLDRQSGRNPLFDVVLSMENMELPEVEMIDIPNLELKNFQGDIVNTSRFDLTITAGEKNSKTYFTFTYNRHLFKADTIRRMVSHFTNLASSILADSAFPINHHSLLDDSEKLLILEDFNNTSLKIPQNQTIHGLFCEQALRTPDQIAVSGNSITDRSAGSHLVNLAYKELDRRSYNLAHQLQEKGATSGSIVAIRMYPCVEMIIAILAVLKAGSAYLPIDPDLPRKRMNAIIKDSAAGLLIDERGIIGSGHSSGCQDSAYVLYTSGSTGRPKGVFISHRGVINLTFGLRERVYQGYYGHLKLALVAPFVFDASVKQIFVSLLSGYCLHIVPTELRVDGGGLLDFYSRNCIDISDGTPIHLSLMSEAARTMEKSMMPRLRHMLIGGEALPGAVVKRFLALLNPHAPVVTNVYGPTECTVDTTSFEIDPLNINTQGIVPIGKPMPNVSCLVMSDRLNLAPIGVPGELVIGGEGVAFGYINNPQLTDEHFVDSSYYGRMYKTGDRCRWMNDGSGNLEYLGRVDQQVKVRGYRVEPGEIENRLLQHEKVRAAVVIAWSPASNDWDKSLCAYIVPFPGYGGEDRTKELWQELNIFVSATLPDYMVPSIWMQLNEIPMTSRGKLDRSRLPIPEMSSNETADNRPSSALEKEIASMWSEILKLDRRQIGINSNFFHLGGHSMGITMLTTRIQQRFNVKIPMVQIFNNPTIAFLADCIEKSGKYIFEPLEAVEMREYYPVTSAQRRFYVLHQLDAQSVGYNTPLMTILSGHLDIRSLEHALNQMVHRHETLRTTFDLVNNEPVQFIHEIDADAEGRGLLEWYELPDNNSNLNHAIAAVIDDFVRPFELSQLFLMRLGLLRIEQDRYLLMWDKHHIITDATASTVFIDELPALYRDEKLPHLSFQYKDFTRWHNKFILSTPFQKQEQFWLNEFSGGWPELNLPLDYPRPSKMSFEGQILEFRFSREETQALNTLASAEEVTLFMLLTAIMNVMLWAISRQEDIVLGTTVMARGHADIQRMMGVFLNTIALRNYPSGQKSFQQFLAEVKDRMLHVFDNQDYPFESLVERLNAARESGRNPLFDVMLVFGWGETSGYGGGFDEVHIDKRLTLLPFDEYKRNISPFDLYFSGCDTPKGLYFSVGYSVGVFKESTVKRFVEYFKEITRIILNDHSIKLSNIEMSHDLIEPEAAQFQINFGF